MHYLRVQVYKKQTCLECGEKIKKDSKCLMTSTVLSDGAIVLSKENNIYVCIECYTIIKTFNLNKYGAIWEELKEKLKNNPCVEELRKLDSKSLKKVVDFAKENNIDLQEKLDRYNSLECKNIKDERLNLLDDRCYFYLSYGDNYSKTNTKKKINTLGEYKIVTNINHLLFTMYQRLNEWRNRDLIYFSIFLTDDENEEPLISYTVHEGRENTLILEEYKKHKDIEE